MAGRQAGPGPVDGGATRAIAVVRAAGPGRRRRGAGAGRRGWLAVRAAVVAAAVVAACVACGGDNDDASPAPKSTPTSKLASKPTVAPADYGAYGTAADDDPPGTHALSPATARLVGPHFAAQFDRVSFSTRLSHALAMNFNYFGDTDHGAMADMGDGSDMDDGDMSGMDHSGHGKQMKGPSLKAAPGHRFMIVHTVPTEGEFAPALPEYAQNIAPEDKVKGEIRVGDKSVKLPGVVRDLSSDHDILVSVPTGGDPVLAITDAGRTQLLNLRTGHREGDEISAYYPLKAAGKDLDVSLSGGYQGAGDGSATLDVHAAAPALQPYAEGRGWARKGRAWLYLGGEVQTRIAAASGTERLDADLDAAGFTLTLPDGSKAHGVGTASTKDALPTAVAVRKKKEKGVASGALAVAFDVPDSFTTGSLAFTPRGDFTHRGKAATFTAQGQADDLRVTID